MERKVDGSKFCVCEEIFFMTTLRGKLLSVSREHYNDIEYFETNSRADRRLLSLGPDTKCKLLEIQVYFAIISMG